MALGVKAGDRVLTSPFSFFATAGTVARLGATPVFADIEPTTYGIDLGQARARGPRCREGRRAGPPLRARDGRRRAPGRRARRPDPRGRGAGDRRDGRDGAARRDDGRDGRVLVLPDQEPRRRGRRGHGGDARRRALRDAARPCARTGRRASTSTRSSAATSGSTRSRPPSSLAALPHLAALTAVRRRENAARYATADSRRPGSSTGASPRPRSDPEHSVHQYVMRMTGGRRDAVQAALKARGIGTMVYYPMPFHLQECFRDLGYERGDFPRGRARGGRSPRAPDLPRAHGPSEQDEVVTAAAGEPGRYPASCLRPPPDRHAAPGRHGNEPEAQQLDLRLPQHRGTQPARRSPA